MIIRQMYRPSILDRCSFVCLFVCLFNSLFNSFSVMQAGSVLTIFPGQHNQYQTPLLRTKQPKNFSRIDPTPQRTLCQKKATVTSRPRSTSTIQTKDIWNLILFENRDDKCKARHNGNTANRYSEIKYNTCEDNNAN